MELDGLQSPQSCKESDMTGVTRKQHEMLSCFALKELYPSIVCFFFKESLYRNEQCLCKFSECVMKNKTWICDFVEFCSLLFCWLVNNQVIYSYGHIYMQLWCQNSKGTHFPLIIHLFILLCVPPLAFIHLFGHLYICSYPSKTYELTHPTCQVWC